MSLPLSDFTQDPFFAVIQQMIAEQGATVWIHTIKNRNETHNAVVVTDSPTRCFRLLCPDLEKPSEWHIHLDVMDHGEMAEFFAAFGNHWPALLGAKVGDAGYPVRGFIKNGRKQCKGWSISIDPHAASVPSRIVINKNAQKVSFENETESEVTVVIEGKA